MAILFVVFAWPLTLPWKAVWRRHLLSDPVPSFLSWSLLRSIYINMRHLLIYFLHSSSTTSYLRAHWEGKPWQSNGTWWLSVFCSAFVGGFLIFFMRRHSNLIFIGFWLNLMMFYLTDIYHHIVIACFVACNKPLWIVHAVRIYRTPAARGVTASRLAPRATDMYALATPIRPPMAAGRNALDNAQ